MSELNFTVIIIAFIIWLLMHILNYLFFSPLVRCMQQRHYYIEGVKEEAENILKDANKLLEEYKEKINKTKLEAYELIKEKRNIFLQEKEKIIKKAKEEASILIEKAMQQITNDINNAKKEIEKEAQSIALLITKQLVKAEIERDETAGV